MRGTTRLEVPRTLEEVCDPRRMALLVYDMQVGIAGRLPGAADFVERVSAVLNTARSSGMPVFFARHMTLPRELMGVSQVRGAMALQRTQEPEEVVSNFSRDSPGFQILPELEPLESEAVLDKISMSFFVGTPLDLALRDLGLDSFAIVGAVLELGIEPTVRHGADLGYLPVVVEDACFSLGDITGKATKERTLSALAGVSLATEAANFGRLVEDRAAAYREE